MSLLRMRVKNNLVKGRVDVKSYTYPGFQRCVSNALTEGLLYETSACLGTTQVTFDEYPARWNPALPPLRDFEVRRGSGGCDSTHIVIKSQYPECPYPTIVREYKGALACPGFSFNIATSLATNNDAANIALNKAWASVTEAQIDMGENIAEAAKTLKMLLAPTKSFIGLLGKMAKGLPSPPSGLPRKGRKWRRVYDILSNRWLEYRYGMMPLILDMEKGIKMYKDTTKPEIRVVGSHGKFIGPSTSVTSEQESAIQTGYYVTWRSSTTTTYVTRAVVYHILQKGDLNASLYKFGVHPTQAISLGWQLLPLSFVVDWIWDVSGFLNCLNPNWGKYYYGNTVSFKSKQELVSTLLKGRCAGTYETMSGVRGTSTGSTEKYTRTANWPYKIRLLRGTDLSSLNRQIDALALAWQQIPRIFRK